LAALASGGFVWAFWCGWVGCRVWTLGNGHLIRRGMWGMMVWALTYSGCLRWPSGPVFDHRRASGGVLEAAGVGQAKPLANNTTQEESKET
jgi:hypothetical protein